MDAQRLDTVSAELILAKARLRAAIRASDLADRAAEEANLELVLAREEMESATRHAARLGHEVTP